MAFFADLLSPPPTFVNVFPISLGKKCPVSHSCQWSVTCRVREKEAFRRAGNARFPRQGHTCGRSIWEDCQLPASGQARGNSFGREGAREVSAIAEAPCDGTDGRVPFVLPPRCPASAMQPHGVVGNGRRDGTARAPRFKRKTVKSLSPTLGITGKSPQHSEDLQRKARPEGERPNNHPTKLLLSIP